MSLDGYCLGSRLESPAGRGGLGNYSQAPFIFLLCVEPMLSTLHSLSPDSYSNGKVSFIPTFLR
jgi:hypothetical protein